MHLNWSRGQYVVNKTRQHAIKINLCGPWWITECKLDVWLLISSQTVGCVTIVSPEQAGSCVDSQAVCFPHYKIVMLLCSLFFFLKRPWLIENLWRLIVLSTLVVCSLCQTAPHLLSSVSCYQNRFFSFWHEVKGWGFWWQCRLTRFP